MQLLSPPQSLPMFLSSDVLSIPVGVTATRCVANHFVIKWEIVPCGINDWFPHYFHCHLVALFNTCNNIYQLICLWFEQFQNSLLI